MTRVNSRINNWDLWSGLEYIISGKTLIVSIYLLPVYVQLHLYTYPRTLNPDPPLRSTDGRCIIKEVITYRMLLFRFMVTWMSLVFFFQSSSEFLRAELFCNVSGKLTVYLRSKNRQSTQNTMHEREQKDHANAQAGRNFSPKKAAMRTPERETARTPSHAQVLHSVWKFNLVTWGIGTTTTIYYRLTLGI